MILQQYRERWLPVNLFFTSTSVSINWIDFGARRTVEPFFYQTIKTLRTCDPAARERSTGLTALLETAATLAPIEPAGIIFHVSRCGSTLVANAIRTDSRSIVVCEAGIFGTFFDPENHDETRRMILQSLAVVYGNSEGVDGRLVLKCHAVGLLQISWIRSLWPKTPFLIVIRDPVEVMISHLGNPAGWMKCRDKPRAAESIFGWSADEVRRMPLEEYCARGLGMFFETALRALDERCRVIDYRKLDLPRLRAVAEFLRAPIAQSNSEDLRSILCAYSKDPTGVRRFEDDSRSKQIKATEAAREAMLRWAQPFYDALKSRDLW
jgi:hypothetical protein